MTVDQVMVSFDDVSLITFIHQDLAYIPIRQLLESGHNSMSLTTDEITILLHVCCNAVFDGIVYQQAKGTAIGPPISGVIAETV